MNITITGVSGFVGKNIFSHLSNISWNVSALSLRNSDWKKSIKADAIIHLAGKAHDTKKTSDASEYFAINTDLTKELFDVFLDSECNDFIYFSSVKAVADEVLEVLFEEVSSNPKTPYGQSKLQAEEYILSKKIPQGKRVFIIRPCMIHGPGNKGNLNLLYNLITRGIPYPLAAFKNQRSFLGIDNLNFMIKEILINKEIHSGIYNFADDEFLSTNEIVEIISFVSKKHNFLVAIPKAIIQGIAKIGDMINLPLNSETVQKLTENYRVSNYKIKSAIGIEKLPNTARQGLMKTLESFLNKN